MADRPKEKSTVNEKISPKVIDFSNTHFNEEEQNILKLGLSFTPTPKPNITELENDLFQFTRKIRILHHFADEQNNSIDLIKPKSTWCPPPTNNNELETKIRELYNTPIRKRQALNSCRKPSGHQSIFMSGNNFG